MTRTDTVKNVPGAVPILGHAPQLLWDPLRFMRSLSAYDGLARIRVGPWKVIVVCDPDLTRQLLVHDRVFDKGGPMYVRLREVLGNGIAGCPYEDHRRQRRALQPAFHSTRISAYATTMTEECERTTTGWRDGQKIDVPAEMMRLTGRIGVRTLLTDTLSRDEFADALVDVNVIMTGLFRRVLIPRMLENVPIPSKRRFDKARASLRRTTHRIIDDYRGSEIQGGGGLLSMFSSSSAVSSPFSSESLSDDEVADQVLTFFLAGIETGSNTLGWALYLLARHPDVQKELHEEVDSVLDGRAATAADIPYLPLTGRILNETLRLYPPGWLFTRTTTEDFELGDNSIPAGSSIAFSPCALHYRPEAFRDPDRFDPSRWSGDSSPAISNSAYLPFGAGARGCIGHSFAITETRITLATICARWQLVASSDRPVRAAHKIQVGPRRFFVQVRDRRASRSASLSSLNATP